MSAALASPASDWTWHPVRRVQINFTEDDPGRFDPKFWLDYVRRTKTHGICLGAGGIVALYPTNFHREIIGVFSHSLAWHPIDL